MSGIFDADKKRNAFAGANLVRPSACAVHVLRLPHASLPPSQIYLGYCSSDAWVGDVGPESNDWKFSFRGQRILEAMLTVLQTQFGMGAVPGRDRLLLSGCSAGARGAMFSLGARPLARLHARTHPPADMPPRTLRFGGGDGAARAECARLSGLAALGG